MVYRRTMPRSPILAAAALAAALSALNPGREARAQQQQPPALGAPVRDEDHTFRRYARNLRELRRENVVMQQRDYSCGAAALATVIQYHWGDEVTETQLLQELLRMLTLDEVKERVQKGLTLTDLRRLAVRVGYQATIGRLEFEKLRESKVPLVVGIVVNDFDHFVVFRGTDGRYVYLADPARGNIRTPIPAFLDQWQKNAVLVVVKPDAVEKVKTSPLSVRPEETTLGELNRRYLRDRLTTKVFPH